MKVVTYKQLKLAILYLFWFLREHTSNMFGLYVVKYVKLHLSLLSGCDVSKHFAQHVCSDIIQIYFHAIQRVSLGGHLGSTLMRYLAIPWERLKQDRQQLSQLFREDMEFILRTMDREHSGFR